MSKTNFPSSDLQIRPASFNDIKFIQDIAYKTWRVAYAKILEPAQMDYMLEEFYSTSSLEEQMKNHHHFFIALLDFAPVGFASFSNVAEKVFKLHKLYVLTDIQKTGSGKKLLDTVETVVKSMGGEKLLLNVNRKNVAQTFYVKNGFKIIKSEDIDIGMGYFMNDYVMEKVLA